MNTKLKPIWSISFAFFIALMLTSGQAASALEFEGGNGRDTMTGTPDADYMVGNGGNDTIDGQDGDDQIFGGPGNDKLRGGSGNDDLDGGKGKDDMNGGAGDDYMAGGDGNDKIGGSAGNDIVEGGAGNDKITGGSGNDILWGDTGNDDLNGGEGDDTLFGGLGLNTLDGASGFDTCYIDEIDDVFVNCEVLINIITGVVISSGTPLAPNAITDLSALATASEQVTLNWSLPSDNGSPITDFEIERDIDGAGFVLIDTIPGPSTTSYVDTTAENDKLNTYVVRAVNAIGTAPNSNSAGATPTAVPTTTIFNIDLIDLFGSAGKDQVRDLNVRVSVSTSGGAPIDGAEITMDITLDTVSVQQITITTGPDGTGEFKEKNVDPGTWSAENVVASHPDALIDWNGSPPTVIDDFVKAP